ncbi:hypothetical protein [Micromonospora eburnea]|uniref:Uncharacterized protein n=1 Tax=Micromonospora eburnea TaxID=227316 RepID=A0A1C6U9S9_9ACTN|nr:hypothetical protein [Micromonospora eburnea]SCL50673.1 hypothetical protein GA0070604_2186 [Micromonospora eburnea]
MTGTSVSNPQANRIGSCPAGKWLYGAGADINAGIGQVLLTGLNITTGDTLRIWANEDADGPAGTWNLTRYGICGCCPRRPGTRCAGPAGRPAGRPAGAVLPGVLPVATGSPPVGLRS